MVDMVPELKPILSDHGRNAMYDDMLPNISTESRFHAVSEKSHSCSSILRKPCGLIGFSKCDQDHHAEKNNHTSEWSLFLLFFC